MMKQILKDFLKKKICFKPAKWTYETIKTVVKQIDNIWSLDCLDLIDCGLKTTGDIDIIQFWLTPSMNMKFVFQ